ncbi:MAG: hypothetical protein D6753_05200, partial [Planctomycetota bacterium]
MQGCPMHKIGRSYLAYASEVAFRMPPSRLDELERSPPGIVACGLAPQEPDPDAFHFNQWQYSPACADLVWIRTEGVPFGERDPRALHPPDAGLPNTS